MSVTIYRLCVDGDMENENLWVLVLTISRQNLFKSTTVPVFDFFRLGIVNVFKLSISNTTSVSALVDMIVQTRRTPSHINTAIYLHCRRQPE